MKEGYQKRLEDQWAQSKFIAYITYASITASVGATPKSFEEWERPGDTVVDPDAPLADAREVDADYKARMEALMNQMDAS